MKARTTTLSTCDAVEKGRIGVFCDLIKARLSTLVLLTTFVGSYLASEGSVNLFLLMNTLIGTALLASGAAALNQLLEMRFDAQMDRTADRPLPSGRISHDLVLMLGGALSASGMIYLILMVNPITSLLGAVTLVSYLFIYTPLKRITTLNTAIGAIPGAIPPLMGWTAVRGEFSIEGWSLFAILFFWQLPHFLAIAWMYRDDYARAGFVMLPVVDPDGQRTGHQALSHTLGLLPISLFPTLLGITGWAYFFGAILLGGFFIYFAYRFASQLSRNSARSLFFLSIMYLPLLLGLMVIDKL